MTVVRHIPGNNSEEMVRIVVKGAPEYVIPCCVETIDIHFQKVSLSEEDQDALLMQTVTDMAKNQLKVISYAYREMTLSTYNNLLHVHESDESDAFRDMIESELIYLGTFGLEDPLREEIQDCV